MNLKSKIAFILFQFCVILYTHAQPATHVVNTERIDSLRKVLLSQQKLQIESLTEKIIVGSALCSLLLMLLVMKNIRLYRKNKKLQQERFKNLLKIQELEDEIKQTRLFKKSAELEMKVLRTQMNPHFIFNSLNSINRFILQNNKAQASQHLSKFSKLVRQILQNSQSSLITLENELETLELYLEMEALRFNYHFRWKIFTHPDVDINMIKVPPLIIQPFAENAIWHGLMHREEKGQLDIEIWRDKNDLFFKITDDGIGRKQSEAFASKSATRQKSMGLRVSADRISLLQPSDSKNPSLNINDLVNPDGSAAGTEVIVKIPVTND